MENNVAQEFPNPGRQLGIDLAKCLSISFMVIVHCLKEFGLDPNIPFFRYFDMTFGSILAAPVFTTAMGVGLAYSRRNSPIQFIYRGINIFILGYALGFVRVLLIGLAILITATIAGVSLKKHIKKKTAENPHSLWRYVNAG